MLAFITKALTIAVLISAPILAGLAVLRAQIAGTYRKIESYQRTHCKDMEYMDCKPHDYMKPELVIQENRRVLNLNTSESKSNEL